MRVTSSNGRQRSADHAGTIQRRAVTNGGCQAFRFTPWTSDCFQWGRLTLYASWHYMLLASSCQNFNKLSSCFHIVPYFFRCFLNTTSLALRSFMSYFSPSMQHLHRLWLQCFFYHILIFVFPVIVALFSTLLWRHLKNKLLRDRFPLIHLGCLRFV